MIITSGLNSGLKSWDVDDSGNLTLLDTYVSVDSTSYRRGWFDGTYHYVGDHNQQGRLYSFEIDCSCL